jgi:hypothetical protein
VAAREPAADPDLEVQVRAARPAGAADLAELLTEGDPVAELHADRAAPEVHEDVVVVLAVAVDDDVVTGAAGLVADGLDGAGARRDDRRAEGGREVLP